jgi:RND family efflux transporter MFP subunit
MSRSHLQLMARPRRATLLRWAGTLFLLGTVAALGACDSDDSAGGSKASKVAKAHLVELAVAEPRALAHRVERTGTLRALRAAKIFNQEEGGVLEVPVREGDAVASGDVLVRLDDRILKAELTKAKATRRQAAADADRVRALAKRELVSQETLSRAQTSLEVARAEERLLSTRLEYMTIRAPFAGRISERHVNAGDVAPKHTHLLTLIDPSSLVTAVSVSELVLPRLRVGDPVEVRIDALGGAVYPGRILRIYPTVDPGTRLGQLEVVLEPVPDGASAGQFCRVTLVTQRAERLVVPLAGLRRDQRGEYVFRIGADDRAQRVAVNSGLRVADQVEILDGLHSGDRVVVSGFLGLDDGTPVQPVTASEGPPPADGGAGDRGAT